MYHGKKENRCKLDTMKRRKIALLMVLGDVLTDNNVNRQEQNKSQTEKMQEK